MSSLGHGLFTYYFLKGLQEKVKQAARSYLSHGNAAVSAEWSEF